MEVSCYVPWKELILLGGELCVVAALDLFLKFFAREEIDMIVIVRVTVLRLGLFVGGLI